MIDYYNHHKLHAIIKLEHQERIKRREYHRRYRAENPLKPEPRGLLGLRKRLRKQIIVR